MKMRTLPCVLTVAAAGLAVAFLARGVGPAPKARCLLPEALSEEKALSVALEEARLRLTHQRNESDFVALELADGRVSLLEAVREIKRINHDRLEYLEFAYRHWSLRAGASQTEVLAIFAIEKADRLLEADGRCDKDAIMARLQSEFSDRFGYPYPCP